MKYVLVLCRILSRISLLFEQIPATTSADIQEVDAKGNQNRKFIVCCRIYVTIVLCLVHVCHRRAQIRYRRVCVDVDLLRQLFAERRTTLGRIGGVSLSTCRWISLIYIDFYSLIEYTIGTPYVGGVVWHGVGRSALSCHRSNVACGESC